jgi:SNF2 family DNA or RNA helicase
VQDQAVDRIHRMGQTSAVTVNLLVAEDTIEERVVELQARKRALAAGALGGGKSAEEIRAMRLNDLKLLVGA